MVKLKGLQFGSVLLYNQHYEIKLVLAGLPIYFKKYIEPSVKIAGCIFRLPHRHPTDRG